VSKTKQNIVSNRIRTLIKMSRDEGLVVFVEQQVVIVDTPKRLEEFWCKASVVLLSNAQAVLNMCKRVDSAALGNSHVQVVVPILAAELALMRCTDQELRVNAVCLLEKSVQVSFREPIDLVISWVSVTAFSSGFDLGSCFWVLSVGENLCHAFVGKACGSSKRLCSSLDLSGLESAKEIFFYDLNQTGSYAAKEFQSLFETINSRVLKSKGQLIVCVDDVSAWDLLFFFDQLKRALGEHELPLEFLDEKACESLIKLETSLEWLNTEKKLLILSFLKKGREIPCSSSFEKLDSSKGGIVVTSQSPSSVKDRIGNTQDSIIISAQSFMACSDSSSFDINPLLSEVEIDNILKKCPRSQRGMPSEGLVCFELKDVVLTGTCLFDPDGIIPGQSYAISIRNSARSPFVLSQSESNSSGHHDSLLALGAQMTDKDKSKFRFPDLDGTLSLQDGKLTVRCASESIRQEILQRISSLNSLVAVTRNCECNLQCEATKLE